MIALQGVWQVGNYGRLERHDSGPLAGLWLGPKYGSGVSDNLMQLLISRNLVTIGPMTVDDGHGNQVTRMCATLTEAGRKLAATPCRFAVPVPPARRTTLFG